MKKLFFSLSLCSFSFIITQDSADSTQGKIIKKTLTIHKKNFTPEECRKLSKEEVKKIAQNTDYVEATFRICKKGKFNKKVWQEMINEMVGDIIDDEIEEHEGIYREIGITAGCEHCNNNEQCPCLKRYPHECSCKENSKSKKSTYACNACCQDGCSCMQDNA